MPYCLNGTLNSHDRVNLEMELASAAAGFAQTLACQAPEELHPGNEVQQLRIEVRIVQDDQQVLWQGSIVAHEAIQQVQEFDR